MWAPFILPQNGSFIQKHTINGHVERYEQTLMAPEDILRVVRKTLDRQPGVLHAEHEDLPASTDIRLLLDHLAEALKTVPNLPLVAIPVQPSQLRPQQQ